MKELEYNYLNKYNIMTTRIRRCGHCRLEGHNISKCTKFKIDIVLNIMGRDRDFYNTNINRSIQVSNYLSIARLAHVKMLIEGLVPHIVWTNHTIYPNPNIYIIRFENNKLTYTLEDSNQEYERLSDSAYRDNTGTCKIYENNFRTRYEHYRQGCVYSNYLNIPRLVIIMTGDYIELTQRIGEEDRTREALYQRWAQERARERENQNIQQNIFVNRERLPTIRETAIEADNCPICLETLTKTSNVVLRCGHQLCLSCLLTQTLTENRMQNTSRWKCCECRTRYL